MMYSSAGRYQVGSWRCEPCDGGSGEVILDPGGFEHLQEDAIAHLQATGHQVTLLQGTRQELIPMRTEPPPTAHECEHQASNYIPCSICGA